ncbi:M1 family metallopeptidase [Psychroflexus salis]|uniref:Peptidase M1 n=1 Tax=Psychroflexus salis TaxID=1526574 RepID=A0A916ZZV3_9FLAO|nr:M1 family metallopeptidase [Psychroflexus salis]GGE20449.1 peptidase M1 [Psychroflexus salis]
MSKFLVLLFTLFSIFSIEAQLLKKTASFTEKDSLRGSLRPERTSYNVLHYDLDIQLNPTERFISGKNTIRFETLNELAKMQLDLYQNMQIDSIIFGNRKLTYERKFDAFFITFDEPLPTETQYKISVYYSGRPKVANNAPWDGGFVFKKDQNGNPWIGVAVQGDGASLWFPNKDHLSDEPDEGADIKVSVPDALMNVSNGRLIAETPQEDGYTQWHWRVTQPINNYNITLNVGDYVNFKNQFRDLDLDFYVLPYNLEKAKKQFAQVQPMMECFYEKLGQYPFVEDGFKLVETPYLGMEHQSAVAYGNQFMNGYLGTDLSGTSYGLTWDFILIHESAHEWFGNSISVADIADLWIHEGFTTYAESIFVECTQGKDEALSYLYGIRKNIKNERPLIGDYGVNHSGPSDIYYKGANMLGTLRSIVNDDDLWWKTLGSFVADFKHRVTDSKEVVAYFSEKLGEDYSSFFDQYLNYKDIPVLEFRKNKKRVDARWRVHAKNFEMPIDIGFVGDEQAYRLHLTNNWIKTDLRMKDLENLKIDIFHFYVDFEFLDED